jgi:hypothetical protein
MPRTLRSATTAVPLALLACACLARPGYAQAVTTLRTPNATLPVDFSQVRGVRELQDGRVLVADRIEERVSVADFATGKLQPIGRTGRGPQEYHLPTALVAMPGDSTLLTDEGNSRLAVIGPDLRIHRSFALHVPGIAVPLGTRGVDAAGRYYIQVPGWVSNARERGDSVWLIRFEPRTQRVDTLASLKGTTSPPLRERRQMGIPFVPFAPQDGWAVTRAGRVAIVRSHDYHVEWLGGEKGVVRGPAVPWDPVPVTPADRMAYTRSFIANSPVGGRNPDGGMSAAPAEFLADRTVRQVAENNEFAGTMGPFTDARPLVGEDGTLWVERATHVGAPSVWDVFDASGRPTRQVRLPPGRRLIALGRAAVYLVAADDDGVERLERYALPPAAGR